jgi:tripartite-type tricarboxylate transporter receptor subunit TctC
LPNLPTVIEEGYPGYEMTAWFTLVAPPATPADVAATLTKALKAALADAGVRQRLLAMGIEPADGSPESMQAQIRAESPIVQDLVKRAHIVVQ